MKSTRVSGVSSIFYPHNLPRRLRLFRIKASEVSNNLFFPSSPIKQLGEKFTDEAIKLGLIPDDEPADEIPDFDVAMEAEVSLERIPADLREQFIKDTPNAEIKGDKLVMRDKPKLPTWLDAGLKDARTWKPSITERKSTIKEAEKRLADGFSVKDPLGNSATFSDETIHWRKNPTEKETKDIFGRLVRLPMAEKCVSQSKEIWELPNGMRNYILDYVNEKGKHRGVAVSVKTDGDVHTYFIEDIKGLNLFRKGELIWKK